jgi:hypothetical protein
MASSARWDEINDVPGLDEGPAHHDAPSNRGNGASPGWRQSRYSAAPPPGFWRSGTSRACHLRARRRARQDDRAPPHDYAARRRKPSTGMGAGRHDRPAEGLGDHVVPHRWHRRTPHDRNDELSGSRAWRTLLWPTKSWRSPPGDWSNIWRPPTSQLPGQLVGEGGFEPPTSCSQSRCATTAPLPVTAPSVVARPERP